MIESPRCEWPPQDERRIAGRGPWPMRPVRLIVLLVFTISVVESPSAAQDQQGRAAGRPSAEGPSPEEGASEEARTQRLARRYALMRSAEEALATNQYSRVRTCVEQVLEIEEVVFGKQNHRVVASLRRLADVLVWLDDFEAARRASGRILEMEINQHGPSSWQARDAERELRFVARRGELLEGDRRGLVEANELFRQTARLVDQGDVLAALKTINVALAALQKHDPAGTATTANVLQCHILKTRCLLELGRFEQAASESRRTSDLAGRFFDRARFPQGHPDQATVHCLVSTLNSLLGDLPAATKAAEEAVSVCRSAYPPGSKPKGSAVSAMSLRILARTYIKSGRVDSTVDLLDECQRLLGQLFPADEYPHGDSSLAVTLDAIGDLRLAQAKYAPATDSFQRALAMRQRLYPKSAFPLGHRRLAANLSRIAVSLERQGRYAEAESYHDRALAMYRDLYPLTDYPVSHRNVATQLWTMSHFQLARGKLDGALNLAEEALQMTTAIFANTKAAGTHPDLVRNHSTLGRVFKHRGEYAKAQTHYERSLEIAQRVFPASMFPRGHYELFDCYNNLGTLAWHLGNMDLAESHFTRSAEMAKQIPAAVGPFREALTHQNLATVLQSRRHLSRARELYEESLARFYTVFPRDRYPAGHPQIANTLMNLGVTLSASDHPEAAARHFAQAAEMLHTLFPQEKYPQGHPLLFRCLINLATEFSQLGNHALSVRCLEQAMDVGQQLYPTDTFPDGHPDLAAALGSLSYSWHALGEYQKAIASCQRSLHMSRSLYAATTSKDRNAVIATTLHNMGVRSLPIGNYEAARMYLHQSLDLRRTLYGEPLAAEHPWVASSLEAIAHICVAEGDFEKARRYLNEATGICRRLTAEPDPTTGQIGLTECLRTAAWLQLKQGQDEMAARTFKEAVRIATLAYPKDTFPDGHPRLAATLADLAGAYQQSGRLEEALTALNQAAEINQRTAHRHLPWVSEAGALNFLMSQPKIRNRLLSVSVQLDKAAEGVYERLWWERGAVQRAMIDRREHVADATDETTRRTYQDWLDHRRQIARLTLIRSHQDPELAAKRGEQLERISKEKDKLERRLREAKARVPKAQAPPARHPIRELRKTLPNDAAFVDIRRYDHVEFTEIDGRRTEVRTPRYLAFVTRSESNVELVELGSAEQIDKTIRVWRRQIMLRSMVTDGNSLANSLHRTVWQPIERVLPDGTKTVFISPDGMFTGLPWAALPDVQSGSILLERLAFVCVLSGESLLEQLRSRPEPRPTAPLLIVGNVDYESAPATAPSKVVLRAPPTAKEDYKWPALPSTVNEVEQVALLADEPPVILSGVEASTANVLNMLPRVARAHFATHGFFADAEFRSTFQIAPELFRDARWPERTAAAHRNPLTLSGIVLAGANRPLSVSDLGLPQGDGGYLIAESIAGLQLTNLDLVTLSACDTGLGESAGREGVFGLQRAFHVAGARTVVASLWKVDDRATRELMQAFYENLYKRRMSKLEALRNAQLHVFRNGVTDGQRRGLVRERVQSGHTPKAITHQWAAWTLSGDWR